MRLPYVTRVDCGLITKYKFASHSCPHEIQYERLSKDFYIDKDGYLRRFNRSAVKGDNIESLKRSFARLRDLINANVVNPENVLFVTFTYDPKKLDEELTLKKVSNDMGNLFRKMKNDGLSFSYIYVVEQQGNGNWHQHVLMFFDSRAPYIEQKTLDDYWSKKGFARISKRFDGQEIYNVGAYVCADLTYGEDKDEHGRIKNERLMKYKSGTRLYRCSRGIKRPVSEPITYPEYVEETNRNGMHKLFESSKVFDVSQGVKRSFHYEHWFDDGNL